MIIVILGYEIINLLVWLYEYKYCLILVCLWLSLKPWNIFGDNFMNIFGVGEDENHAEISGK